MNSVTTPSSSIEQPVVRLIPESKLTILGFVLLIPGAAVLSFWVAWLLPSMGGEASILIRISVALITWFSFWYTIYRLILLKVGKLPDGPVSQTGSAASFYWIYRMIQVYVLFPMLHTSIVPVMIRMAIAVCCGTRIGRGTVCSGWILDPPFLEIGNNNMIGFNAVLTSHSIEVGIETIGRIRVGNNCLIGGSSVLMPGVVVGDGATVASGAVVLKGTIIPRGEIWGGVPAKCIRKADGSKP